MYVIGIYKDDFFPLQIEVTVLELHPSCHSLSISVLRDGRAPYQISVFAVRSYVMNILSVDAEHP